MTGARVVRVEGPEGVSLAGDPAARGHAPPAISASTRSASAAKSRCEPVCTCRSRSIAAPVVHFGLGDATGAEVARITWPNGVLQSEFDLAADAAIAASQRLKGSCPWLFAWNGTRDGFRHRLHLALTARPAHQRAGDGRRADDGGLGQHSRRSARSPERRVRPAHHRRVVGDALLRSRLAAGRRSSRRGRRCSSTSGSPCRRRGSA